MDEVFKSARPLSDILWMRETENGAFETPERHAALEGHHEAVSAQRNGRKTAMRDPFRQDNVRAEC